MKDTSLVSKSLRAVTGHSSWFRVDGERKKLEYVLYDYVESSPSVNLRKQMVFFFISMLSFFEKRGD